MPVGLYADVHLPGPLILQSRLRGVSMLAATEEGAGRLQDHQLLDLATSLQRVIVTQDIRFRVLAEDWQRTGRRFAGLDGARHCLACIRPRPPFAFAPSDH